MSNPIFYALIGPSGARALLGEARRRSPSPFPLAVAVADRLRGLSAAELKELAELARVVASLLEERSNEPH